MNVLYLCQKKLVRGKMNIPPADSNVTQGARHVYPPGVKTKIFQIHPDWGRSLSTSEDHEARRNAEATEDPLGSGPQPLESAPEELGPDVIKLVAIGPNGTTVPMKVFKYLDWSSGVKVTQEILSLIFDKETLATHSLLGKFSPALDPLIVEDIVYLVTEFCNCTAREVSMAITTQCANESKMLERKRKREQF